MLRQKRSLSGGRKPDDLEVQRFAREGPIYVLQTSAGLKGLKKSGLSQLELEYITHSLADIDKQGCTSVVVPLPASDGSRYFRFEDSYYFLMDWVKGRHCDYPNETDAVAVAKTLGRLHDAFPRHQVRPRPGYTVAAGFLAAVLFPPAGSNEGLCPGSRQKTVPSSFDQLYLRDFHHYYRQGIEGLEKLADSSYFELCQDLSLRAFCHRDLAYHNVVMNGEGIKFLDFDYSMVDLGLHDLADLLLRNLVLLDWNWERANASWPPTAPWFPWITGPILYWRLSCTFPTSTGK